MIPKYSESSQEVSIHSNIHTVCTHEMEDGWECSCSDCTCQSIVNVQATYAFDKDGDHKVIVNFNPGQYHGGGSVALPPNVARALAAALSFAANDAETLNKNFPPEPR